jgi:hypothetical protein
MVNRIERIPSCGERMSEVALKEVVVVTMDVNDGVARLGGLGLWPHQRATQDGARFEVRQYVGLPLEFGAVHASTLIADTPLCATELGSSAGRLCP